MPGIRRPDGIPISHGHQPHAPADGHGRIRAVTGQMNEHHAITTGLLQQPRKQIGGQFLLALPTAPAGPTFQLLPGNGDHLKRTRLQKCFPSQHFKLASPARFNSVTGGEGKWKKHNPPGHGRPRLSIKIDRGIRCGCGPGQPADQQHQPDRQPWSASTPRFRRPNQRRRHTTNCGRVKSPP